MSTSLTNAAIGDEEEVLRWQVHLAKDQPRKLAGVIAIVASVGALSYVWFGSIIPVLVMAFAVAGALSDFLLPVTYRLTSTHASASTLVGKQLIAWNDVRTVYLDDSGAKLSPLPGPSRLEAYRGVYLRFGDRREEVLDTVARLRP